MFKIYWNVILDLIQEKQISITETLKIYFFFWNFLWYFLFKINWTRSNFVLANLLINLKQQGGSWKTGKRRKKLFDVEMHSCNTSHTCTHIVDVCYNNKTLAVCFRLKKIKEAKGWKVFVTSFDEYEEVVI